MAVQTAQSSDLLRRTLRGNSIFCLLSGLALTLGAAPIASLMGIADASLILTIMGIVILCLAVLLWIATAKPPVDRRFGLIIFMMDAVWVAASGIVLVTDAFSLTTEGRWMVLIAAEIVAVFAILEFIGLRRLR